MANTKKSSKVYDPDKEIMKSIKKMEKEIEQGQERFSQAMKKLRLLL